MLCQGFFASFARRGLIVTGSLFFGVACGGTTTASSGAPITGAAGGASGGGGDSASGGSVSSTGGSGGHTSPTGAPASHRATADTCSHDRGVIVASPEAGVAVVGEDASAGCVSDRDCTAGVNGRCEQLVDGLRYPTWFCTYDECFTDGDCQGPSAACICGESLLGGVFPASSRGPNTCVTGNCRVDADCGQHGYCSLSVEAGPCSVVTTPVGLYCHTPQDDCTGDSDCTQPLTGCAYSTALGKWTCTARGGCNG